jgi:hypothetical protein
MYLFFLFCELTNNWQFIVLYTGVGGGSGPGVQVLVTL